MSRRIPSTRGPPSNLGSSASSVSRPDPARVTRRVVRHGKSGLLSAEEAPERTAEGVRREPGGKRPRGEDRLP